MSSSTHTQGNPQPERYARTASRTTFALRSLLRTYTDLQRHIARVMSLGHNDVAALEHLVSRADLGTADVAALLGISTASATVLVDRLESAGHVERRPHSRDRRRKQLVVTGHAQDEMFAALQPLFTIHREIDQTFSDEEQAVISSYLDQVTARYRQHLQGAAADDSP